MAPNSTIDDKSDSSLLLGNSATITKSTNSVAFGLLSKIENSQNAVAFGRSTNATNANRGMAIGSTSTVLSENGVAVGAFSEVKNSESAVVLGKSANAKDANNAMALGAGATVSAENAVALGNGANTSGKNGANTSGKNAAAVGKNSKASGKDEVAIGHQATAGKHSGFGVSIGTHSYISEQNTKPTLERSGSSTPEVFVTSVVKEIAKNQANEGKYFWSIVVGTDSRSYGYQKHRDWCWGWSLCGQRRCHRFIRPYKGDFASAIGYSPRASSKHASAFGTGSTATAEGGLALGNFVVATEKGGVVLGSHSKTSVAGNVWGYNLLKSAAQTQDDLIGGNNVTAYDTAIQELATLKIGGSEVVTENNFKTIFNKFYEFKDGLKTETDTTDTDKTIVTLGKDDLKNDSDFKGDKGDKGDQGADGKSAFEIWRELPGNTGKTEADFAAASKGEKGDKGDKGESGQDGSPGKSVKVASDGRGNIRVEEKADHIEISLNPKLGNLDRVESKEFVAGDVSVNLSGVVIGGETAGSAVRVRVVWVSARAIMADGLPFRSAVPK